MTFPLGRLTVEANNLLSQPAPRPVRTSNSRPPEPMASRLRTHLRDGLQSEGVASGVAPAWRRGLGEVMNPCAACQFVSSAPLKMRTTEALLSREGSAARCEASSSIRPTITTSSAAPGDCTERPRQGSVKKVWGMTRALDLQFATVGYLW